MPSGHPAPAGTCRNREQPKKGITLRPINDLSDELLKDLEAEQQQSQADSLPASGAQGSQAMGPKQDGKGKSTAQPCHAGSCAEAAAATEKAAKRKDLGPKHDASRTAEEVQKRAQKRLKTDSGQDNAARAENSPKGKGSSTKKSAIERVSLHAVHEHAAEQPSRVAVKSFGRGRDKKPGKVTDDIGMSISMQSNSPLRGTPDREQPPAAEQARLCAASEFMPFDREILPGESDGCQPRQEAAEAECMNAGEQEAQQTSEQAAEQHASLQDAIEDGAADVKEEDATEHLYSYIEHCGMVSCVVFEICCGTQSKFVKLHAPLAET